MEGDIIINISLGVRDNIESAYTHIRYLILKAFSSSLFVTTESTRKNNEGEKISIFLTFSINVRFLLLLNS